ncbi:hypothetical protein Ahy_A03g015449 [Arachis hypogaea]|uniref:Aminotransferase-like plant mobile domain-containing protein n=1 Tax=Arachis hypogaea TaxID=3818 RepID=A0A445E0E6_ARAHY|nr:hypothetical protein Ahy_A03g015449 [Arachis hypogaea]
MGSRKRVCESFQGLSPYPRLLRREAAAVTVSAECSGVRRGPENDDNEDVYWRLCAFIEKWHPEMHTFHMSFKECTITLQDVAYQMELSVDEKAIIGCHTDFDQFMEDGRPVWE